MRRTRVLFDREIFVRQNFGGISRYFSELFREFRSDPSLQIEPLLGFSRSSNMHLQATLHDTSLSMRPLRPTIRGLPRMMNGPEFAKDAFLTYRAGRTPHRDIDVLHATYLRPRALDRRRSAFQIVTIQDMIAEQLALPLHHPARRGKAEVIVASDLVITTSRFTADIMQAEWPDKEIRVIPLGVDIRYFEGKSDHAPMVPFPYVLFVGGRSGYKNFSVLQAAMQILRQKHDIGLVCVGPPVRNHEREALRFLTDCDRFVHLQASDDQLPSLYRDSAAFVFPSTMEGFGLPVLEAAASGCAVVLSDIPIFREHGSDWAEFFDPSSPEELANTLGVVLDSPVHGVAPPAVRDSLSSWADVARRHALVYQEVARMAP